jgi:hypothetical protein
MIVTDDRQIFKVQYTGHFHQKDGFYFQLLIVLFIGLSSAAPEGDPTPGLSLKLLNQFQFLAPEHFPQ